jgi:hypothetical protein
MQLPSILQQIADQTPNERLLADARLLSYEQRLHPAGVATMVGDHVHLSQRDNLVAVLGFTVQGNGYRRLTTYGDCWICDSQCDTCRDGCSCGGAGTGCEHWGCWGPNSTHGCPDAQRLSALRERGPVPVSRY